MVELLPEQCLPTYHLGQSACCYWSVDRTYRVHGRSFFLWETKTFDSYLLTLVWKTSAKPPVASGSRSFRTLTPWINKSFGRTPLLVESFTSIMTTRRRTSSCMRRRESHCVMIRKMQAWNR
jgi:hypothetical protein